MVNYSFFSFLNSISSYSIRLCAPSDSKPYGALGIRIEIVLPLPPKMGWQHCVTNTEPLQARIQTIKPWWSNVWCSAKQATIYRWLGRFWLRCSGDHMCRKRVTDSWHSTVVVDSWRCTSDVMCKQKQTSALCATNGERNTSNRLWTCLLQQMRLKHFEIINCLFQLNIGQVMWRVLKYTSNP